MRKSLFVIVLIVIATACVAGPAFAFDESTSTNPPMTPENCDRCHNPWAGGLFDGIAVHGGYTTTTDKCGACHDVHAAKAGGQMLLPGVTIQDTCYTCHDGTQGRGVYGAIKARGFTVVASHRNETTSIVPGGNASDGGSSTVTFGGLGGTMSCDDCHSPHGASTVATFSGDRDRTASFSMTYDTNRLLKQRPGGATTATPVYGSDWCAACHGGRRSGSVVHNHPVESTMTAGAGAYYYQRVPLISGATPTTRTVMGAMGRSNSGYLMPMPRSPEQAGHAPICQQCHEDPRNVGSLNTTGAATGTAFIINNPGDGFNVNDNPRFQNFPHESTSTAFLVETNDDLCMNCHPPGLLP